MSAEPADAGIDRAFYHRFAWAYDALITRPGGPQTAQVAALLRENGCPANGHLIDAGCGSGGYAVALSLAGFAVTAVDRSLELLDAARQRAASEGASIRFAHVDLTGEWSPAVSADAVLCRGVLNDVLTDAARSQAFSSFARWLGPGGILLLDVRDRERSRERYAHGKEFTQTALRDGDQLVFSSRTTMAPGGDRLELVERWQGSVNGEQVAHEDRFTMRTWSWNTLRSLAETAGFASISRLDGERLGARSDRIVALATKPAAGEGSA